MIDCKYTKNRKVPISFNQEEDFKNINAEYFFLCKIISGYIVIRVNNQLFHISSDSLLSFPRDTEIEVVASYKLKAMSVSFAPEFMNVNLNWNIIDSSEYSSLVKEFNYPSFFLFYKRNMLYQGILPIDNIAGKKINTIFRDVIKQLSEQPNEKWSCEARTNIFILFDIAEHFCSDFMKGSENHDSLEAQILDHINLNLCSKIKIDDLCKEFHTNHTTIQNKFKAYTNYSIADYIIEKRLSIAKHALSFTCLSIEKISEKIGYSNVSYFATLFKNRVGMTPTGYRMAMRNKRKLKMIQ